MTGKNSPKISGLLHNCALNCALPILLKGIDSVAELESRNALNAISDDSLIKSYELLKNCFSSYYNISGSFTFQNFSNFLKQKKLSFYAKEIIFAPVFRAFMAAKCEYDDVSSLTNIQSSGSYIDLHHNEAYQLFYKYFGISIKAFEFKRNMKTGNSQDNYEEIPYRPQALIESYPFETSKNISLYLKNQHYELYPHEDLTEAGLIYNDEVNNLHPALKKVHNSLNFSQSYGNSNLALTELRQALRSMTNELSNKLVVENESPKKNIGHSKSALLIFSKSSAKNLSQSRKEQNSPINLLISKYFGQQTRAQSNVGGIFGGYLHERSKTYALKDYFSQCLACLFGCFGYQTEAQERENYLGELLTCLHNLQDIADVADVREKILQGKDTFSPRNEAGKDYLCSLSCKLSRLEKELFNLVSCSQNMTSIRGSFEF